MDSPSEQPDIRGDALSGLGERRKEGEAEWGLSGFGFGPDQSGRVAPQNGKRFWDSLP